MPSSCFLPGEELGCSTQPCRPGTRSLSWPASRPRSRHYVVAATVVDDDLLGDILVGHRNETVDRLAPDGVATTGLWLFRLCSWFADPTVVGKLSGPVASLPEVYKRAFG